MPLHDYRCPTCGKQREAFLKIEDLNSTVYCAAGHPMVRKLAKPWVRGDYPAYESPVIPGKIIEGRRAHEEHLKETGCRVLEPGETDSYKRRIARDEQAFDRKIEDSVDEEISKLPLEKREKLAAELEGGLSAEVVRTAPNAT